MGIRYAPNSGFSLPENDELPIIMVGPGAGIAPFRGFLQEREFRKARGKPWLLFGDRQATTVFLYEDELADKLNNGALHRIDFAFSRDQKNKLYVQHRMLEHPNELYQ
jgi:sulfite reductase (NADPH) flavoprotein alpha-component